MNLKELLEANTGRGRRRILHTFRDFCEISALTIRNSSDLSGRSGREARYLSLIEGYAVDEIHRFAAMLGELAMAIQAEKSDVLGDLFMRMDLGNDALGQIFTPYSMCRVGAQMAIDCTKDLLEQRDFITFSDPTCGSGGMLIALIETLQEHGINYQKVTHFTAQDVDITAVHMTYVQLSLLGVPAVVAHGDTLLQTQFDVWPTPAHITGRWSEKLR